MDHSSSKLLHLVNPLELKAALFFGAFLVLVIFLGKLTIHFYGETGLFLLAALSGIADVDPINLTLSRMSIDDLSPDVAVLGLVIASSTNTMVKAMLTLFFGCPGLGVRILVPLLAVAIAGLFSAWLM